MIRNKCSPWLVFLIVGDYVCVDCYLGCLFLLCACHLLSNVILSIERFAYMCCGCSSHRQRLLRFVFLSQQGRQFANIRFIGRGNRYCMSSTTIHIRTDIDLHAKVPLISFTCLVHFRITFALDVFGRGRSSY